MTVSHLIPLSDVRRETLPGKSHICLATVLRRIVRLTSENRRFLTDDNYPYLEPSQRRA
jgi:hypothetical protein